MNNGCYYDPFTVGQGFDIFGNLGYWYTHEAGQQRWYYFNGPKLYTTSGGTFADPTKRTVHEIGTVRFKDNVFIYEDDEHGRGAIELTAIATSDDPRSGGYYDVTKAGSGLSVQHFGDRCSAYWYTYESGKQRWFSCSGEPSALNIYEWVGGVFRYPGGELLPAGSATLTDTLFTYNLDAMILLKAQGQLNLTRLF